MGARNRVTVRDVAKAAAVSLATVSRALSGTGYVRPETRSRVLQAVRTVGYKPNAAARSLRMQRTEAIGLMITDIVNPFYSYLADGVLHLAGEWGYHVILCATDEDPGMERDYLEVLMQKRVDGIIAVPTGDNVQLWQEAIDLGTKLILVDRELAGLSGASVVLVDNVQGAHDATEHLIKLGHRRIGLSCGPISTTTGRARLEGYCRAHQESDVPIDQDLVQIGSFKREDGFRAARRLLALQEPPSAIFAANNVLGEAAMFAIRERQMRIPDDISLLFFDDVPWASLVIPAVTVVAQPTQRLGQTSCELLVQRLHEQKKAEQPPRRIVLQPELIMRESCAPYVAGRERLSAEGQTTHAVRKEVRHCNMDRA